MLFTKKNHFNKNYLYQPCFALKHPTSFAGKVRCALGHAGVHRGGDGEEPAAGGVQDAPGGADLRCAQLRQVHQGRPGAWGAWGW